MSSTHDLSCSRKIPKGDPENKYRFRDTPSRLRQPSRMCALNNGDINGRVHAPSEGRGPRLGGTHRSTQGQPPMAPATAWAPAFGASNVRTADVWKYTDTSGSTRSRYTSHSILNKLRLASGGIVYMKRSELQYAVYVDDREIYRFNLAPSSLLTPEDSLILHTEIGKGSVCQEALDLLGYSYSETPSGNFSIPRNLYLVRDTSLGMILRTLRLSSHCVKNEITELVRLSYQGFSRGLEERSRQMIEERGWRELVVSKQELPFYPREQHRSPETCGEWMFPWDRPLNSDVKHERNDYSDPDTDEFLENRGSSPSPHNGPLPTVNGPTKIERDTGRKGPAAEKRFTLPSMDSAQHARKTSTIRESDDRDRGREVWKGEEYSLAEERRDNLAVSERDVQPSLEGQALPDTKPRNKRSWRSRKRDQNTAPIKKPSYVPPTVMEISNGLSTEPEGFLRR